MIKTKRLRSLDKKPPMQKSSVETIHISKKRITNKQIDIIINETYNWCVKNLGISPHKDLPIVSWDWKSFGHADLEKKFIAMYDASVNEISIKITGHRTLKNLVRTFIHEYVHYLQPEQGGWYDRYDKKYGYDNNPYEIEAYYISDLYVNDAVSYVVKKLKL